MSRMTWGRYDQFDFVDARDRFLLKTRKAKNGCLEWTGCRGGGGRYGALTLMNKPWLAHRAAWLLFNGEHPGSKCVIHRCDNGICVNLDHLSLGTQRDNVLDMERKKRSVHPRGERHGRSKLSASDIGPIKDAAKQGETHKSIANRYGVCRPSISRILNGKGWKE
jgi:hypothetical protein